MIRAKEYSVTPPFHALPGDVIERDGTVARLKRNGATIATSTLGPATTLDSGDVTTRRVISSIFEAEEIRMSLALEVVDVVHNPDGSKQINFPGGSGITVQPEDFDTAVTAVNSDEWKLSFILARMKAHSPDLSSDASISGFRFEWNPASDLSPMTLGEV
jgi:hypothetical protein